MNQKFIFLFFFSFLLLSSPKVFIGDPWLPAFAGMTSHEDSLLPTSLHIPEKIPRVVNIGLLIDVSSCTISTEGPYQLKMAKRGALFEAQPLEATFRAEGEGIKMNQNLYLTDRVTVSVSKGTIQVGKRKYKRQIQILKTANGKLTIINQMDLEEYLKGVLPLEMHPDWPMESLKAQAVTSRTFALFKMLEKKDQPYVVTDTVKSQVYGGSLFHKDSTTQAVNLTKGEILTFNGEIFPAYFHATCGGRTAQADAIWEVQANPVLKGTECHFCKGTKHWKWSLAVPLKKLEAFMQEKGYPAKHLSAIQFGARDKSGRATKVTLKYKRSILTIHADDFRAYLGYDQLKSLKASVTVKDGIAYFSGYGWGHGIGYCQWGSKVQSEQKKNYREILRYYFPASDLVRT